MSIELCDRPFDPGPAPYDGKAAVDVNDRPVGDESAPGVDIKGFWSPKPNPVGDPVEFELEGEFGGRVLDPLLFWYCEN